LSRIIISQSSQRTDNNTQIAAIWKCSLPVITVVQRHNAAKFRFYIA